MKMRWPLSALAVALLWAPALCAQVIHALPAEDYALEGMPVDLYAVGAVEGASWGTLYDVRSIGFDDDANLYVLDADARVLKFDPRGEFVRQIGHKGQGPGEIDVPLAMAVGGDGSVVVVDPTGGYHVFGPDGEHESTIRPTLPAFSNQVVLVGDTLMIAGGTLASMRAGREGRGLPVVRQPLREGAPTELAHEADVPTIDATVTPPEGGRSTFTFRRPPSYAASLKVGAAADGMALVSGTGWKIDMLTGGGSVAATLVRPLPARASNAGDRAVLEARAREAEAQGGARSFGGAPPAGPRRSRAGVNIADTIPIIRAVRGDGAGLLLVARETDPVAGDTPRIDVVRNYGSYVGTVSGQRLPAALGPDRLAAYVETDELGVERVVVRRLPEEWMER